MSWSFPAAAPVYQFQAQCSRLINASTTEFDQDYLFLALINTIYIKGVHTAGNVEWGDCGCTNQPASAGNALMNFDGVIFRGITNRNTLTVCRESKQDHIFKYAWAWRP